jgi:hypothetical protein
VIGVISKDSETRTVGEFFELFKTPWEHYVPGQTYQLVITTTGNVPGDLHTSLLAVYDSRSIRFDSETGVVAKATSSSEWLEYADGEIPLYGAVLAFEPAGQPLLLAKGRNQLVGLEFGHAAYRVARVGYDLFQEVEFLLSEGQPPENAHVPTLELHIAVLRNIMTSAGLAFVEIPPAPAGYEFMACLTHDVDFTGIREHKFDSTMWGFVYRALVGSLIAALRGRLAWSKCWTNWQAVFSLPLVYSGLKADLWLEFDCYAEIEKDLGSTYFFIPFKNRPGTRDGRSAPKRRGAKYDLSRITDQVHKLVTNGCEVGLHGIDAWQDSQKAQVEAAPIRDLAGRSEVGIRMHWLYFDRNSPKVLAEAGFSYDSTFGYNDAVGFRGGTAQIFSIPPANSFLELPLIIQDTALFYPGRMHLSESEAMKACRQVIQQTVRFGGAVTVNWHTRSLSPERLWGDFYQEFIAELRAHRVWFGTASEVVDWFRMRRAVRFERVQFNEDGVKLKIDSPPLGKSPAFFVRVHHPRTSVHAGTSASPNSSLHSDVLWNGHAELTVPQLEPSRV